MTDVSIDAPATITITHPGGSDMITVTVPASPVTPPVQPPVPRRSPGGDGRQARPRSPSRPNHTLGITATGAIMQDGAPIPGGDGSAAVGYDPPPDTIYGQDAASRTWWHWDGKQMDTARTRLDAAPGRDCGAAA